MAANPYTMTATPGDGELIVAQKPTVMSLRLSGGNCTATMTCKNPSGTTILSAQTSVIADGETGYLTAPPGCYISSVLASNASAAGTVSYVFVRNFS